ncbi:MAG: hypothetical protein EG825_02095, partial [Rhodocyclaceae bacterium]|nr:hypothetical protein [Rhodocyclaceae bacterium]
MDKKVIASLIASIFGSAPFLAAIAPSHVAAGANDIANSPMANRRSEEVKPNIMLILDDSGSMLQDFMPETSAYYPTWGPGRRSFQCNTIFYDPTIPTGDQLGPYLIPKDNSGYLNNATQTSFTSAYDNGYWAFDKLGQSSGVATVTDLDTTSKGGTGFPPVSSLAMRSYYWRYEGSGTITPTSPECALALGTGAGPTPVTGGCYSSTSNPPHLNITTASPTSASCTAPRTLAWKIASGSPTVFDTVTGICSDGASPPTFSFATDAGVTCPSGTLVWRRVEVSSTSSSTGGYDERQRFANWYSYYRTRFMLTKAAIGRAFQPLVAKEKFRVGFITINPKQFPDGGVDGSGNATFATSSSVYVYPSTPNTGFDGASLSTDYSYNTKFLEVRDFSNVDTTRQHPQRFFDILYAQRGNDVTPLRKALARVGRYYAGKGDLENSGMIDTNHPDPVNYACQQNFSILATDGSWDGDNPNVTSDDRGFKINGSPFADNENQDGDLSEVVISSVRPTPNELEPLQTLSVGLRPTFDGSLTHVINTLDALNNYQYKNCVWYIQNTNQNLQSTDQVLQSTTQTLQSTHQNLKSTLQNLKSTSQTNQTTSQINKSTTLINRDTAQINKSTSQLSRSTSQLNKSTSQLNKSTVQNLRSTSQLNMSTTQINLATVQTTRSTVQNLKSTTQNVRSTVQVQKSTSQLNKSTTLIRKSTTQVQKSTTQTAKSTSQLNKSTTLINKSTVQNLKSTAQVTKSTSQLNMSTTLVNKSTSQVNKSTTQLSKSTAVVQRSTYQTLSCDMGGNCTPVSSCIAQAEVNTCDSLVTGPTPVASCTSATASSSNSWTTVTCTTTTTTPSGVASCTSAAASSSNSWTATTCATVTTAASAVASCSTAAASSSNSYTATSCPTVTTGPSGVTSCTSAAASS